MSSLFASTAGVGGKAGAAGKDGRCVRPRSATKIWGWWLMVPSRESLTALAEGYPSRHSHQLLCGIFGVGAAYVGAAAAGSVSVDGLARWTWKVTCVLMRSVEIAGVDRTGDAGVG